jgi:hypothetical protein
MPLRIRKIPKRWKPPARLRPLLPKEIARERATGEHDDQVQLFRDHIWPRLVDGAVVFAIGNGRKRHPKVAREMKEEGCHCRRAGHLRVARPPSLLPGDEEAKGRPGVVGPKQLMARLVGAGAICAVARGLDEAIKQLEA